MTAPLLAVSAERLAQVIAEALRECNDRPRFTDDLADDLAANLLTRGAVVPSASLANGEALDERGEECRRGDRCQWILCPIHAPQQESERRADAAEGGDQFEDWCKRARRHCQRALDEDPSYEATIAGATLLALLDHALAMGTSDKSRW